ncbi:MAG: hypothetical protein KGO01_05820 [Burkholderiales bacterium]|nr:hypothetical protein [Burkholderiales bacterium]
MLDWMNSIMAKTPFPANLLVAWLCYVFLGTLIFVIPGALAVALCEYVSPWIGVPAGLGYLAYLLTNGNFSRAGTGSYRTGRGDGGP